MKTWCKKVKLSVNLSKADAVLFNSRYCKGDSLPNLTMCGRKITVAKEAKYLGIMLDSRLGWKSHLEIACEKATQAYWACSRLFGKTWGLGQEKVKWLLTSVL